MKHGFMMSGKHSLLGLRLDDNVDVYCFCFQHLNPFVSGIKSFPIEQMVPGLIPSSAWDFSLIRNYSILSMERWG